MKEKKKNPILFTVDDDPQVSHSIRRDLRKQYGKEYRVIASENPQEALDALSEFKAKGEEVALFLSDQRMPEIDGVTFLKEAKKFYPLAKRALLTAYSDTDAAIKAINDVQLDYYLLKPWDPPEEKLYPVVEDLLDDWHLSRKPEDDGLRVIGYQYSPKSHAIKDFLSGNLIPYKWLDVENDKKATELLNVSGCGFERMPVVYFEDGSYLADPTLVELGEKLGMQSEASQDIYDVAIIGAGPSGMASAVYGGSEGLNTLLLERKAPGGQAGTSSRIENYLGFPKGLSGSDLTHRAITQATRFGVEFLNPIEVTKIETKNGIKIIHTSEDRSINAKSIILAMGVDYRKLEADNIDNFTGAGVYYGAARTEAVACKDKDVYIVGGGNSAGQAAMYMSNYAANVFIVVRKEDLSSSMSDYLIKQCESTSNISVVPNTEVTAVHGEDRLERMTLKTGEESREVEAGALLIFIGSKPHTEWLGEEIATDDRGFVITGREIERQKDYTRVWKLERDPFLLETSCPGIFAAGDVRNGAMNRVASAVGEGSMAIKFVHEYLSTI